MLATRGLGRDETQRNLLASFGVGRSISLIPPGAIRAVRLVVSAAERAALSLRTDEAQ